MINLLPPDHKQEYRYARRNSALLRLVSFVGTGLVGLVGLTVAGAFYLQQTATTYSRQAAATRTSLEDQNQKEVEKQVQDISGSLKLAVQVLSQEVLFSKLLTQLAVVTPSNVTLSGISISQLQGGVDITAKTTDYNAATQLHINLADPNNKIFEKADIVSVTCAANPEPEEAQYPCTAVIRTLFAQDNPFLFINSGAAE